MKWYKHMSNMRHDPKIKRLKKKYGAEGYSMYVEIVTAISENLDPINNILPFLEEDIFEIAAEFDIADHKAIEIVNFCVNQGLLEKSTNDYIFCFKLYKFVDEYFTKKQANTLQVADRNKVVITAYKEGGLPLALATLQHYIADLMAIIGEIEVNNGNKRANLALLSPNSGVNPDQRRPEEIILEENKLDNIKSEEKKESADAPKISPSPKKEFGKFTPKEKEKPKFVPGGKQPENKPDSLSAQIKESVDYWNTFENLPVCKYIVPNLPSLGDIRSKFDDLGLDDIKGAIKNLSELQENELPKYWPTSYHNFITVSVDRWLDSCRPWLRYDSKTSVEPKRELTENEKLLAYYTNIRDNWKNGGVFGPEEKVMIQAEAKVKELEELVRQEKENKS